MNVKKIIKSIAGLGVISGVAYAAYQVGVAAGETKELDRRLKALGDRVDLTELDDEDEYRFYDHMDEPDDGCVSPVERAGSDDPAENTEPRFMPIEIIHIDGIALNQLRGLLLYLTVLKSFSRKNVKDYLGIDDDPTVDLVLESFVINGYISKRDKYRYRALTTITDYADIIRCSQL